MTCPKLEIVYCTRCLRNEQVDRNVFCAGVRSLSWPRLSRRALRPSRGSFRPCALGSRKRGSYLREIGTLHYFSKRRRVDLGQGMGWCAQRGESFVCKRRGPLRRICGKSPVSGHLAGNAREPQVSSYGSLFYLACAEQATTSKSGPSQPLAGAVVVDHRFHRPDRHRWQALWHRNVYAFVVYTATGLRITD